MARTKKQKTIKVTLEVEPPYTKFAVLTFGGISPDGMVVTSKPMALKDKSVILVGENGGIEQVTGNEAKRRKGAAGKASGEDDD